MTKPLKRAYFRSIIFNLLFYSITGFMCLLYLLLLPLPRSYFLRAIEFWVDVVQGLEKYILGLDYEIRGLENLPKDGAYIVAAKHQSVYETFKLHKFFKDPAIILKQELLKIPLWGLYLKKADPIAIDRSSPKQANLSINQGALRVKDQGRPIIIFPQGTRVRPNITAKDKPYKSGIFGIQKATNLPIIPLALNTGAFWPRNDFFKSSGKVIFEFLEPITPGKTKQELMQIIEDRVEAKSKILTEEAVEEHKKQDRGLMRYWFMLLLIIAGLFGLYSYIWVKTADHIKGEYYKTLAELTGEETREESMEVAGYPGMIRLSVAKEIIVTAQGRADLNNVKAVGWVFPGLPIHIEAGPVSLQDKTWSTPLSFDHIDATLKIYAPKKVEILNSEIKQDTFTAKTGGTIDLAQEPLPKLDLNIAFINHQDILGQLAKNRIIDARMALFLSAGLGGLADEHGVVNVPLVQREEMLYVGPIPVFKIPQQQPAKEAAQREEKAATPLLPLPATPSQAAPPPQQPLPDAYSPPGQYQ